MFIKLKATCIGLTLSLLFGIIGTNCSGLNISTSIEQPENNVDILDISDIESERANLAESILMALNGNKRDGTNGTEGSFSTEKLQTTVDHINNTINITEDASKAVTTSEASIVDAQRIPVSVVIQNLPTNANLFDGLAKNVGQLNIGGIIMEAFKLAQNSIVLFSQSLAGQLGSQILIINNSTRLVGVGK